MTVGGELSTSSQPLTAGPRGGLPGLPRPSACCQDHVPGGHRHGSPRRDRCRIARCACDEALDLATWQPTTWRGGSGTLEIEPEGPRATPPSRGWERGRRVLPAAPVLPALVSDNVATQTGGTVEIGLAGQRLQVEPVAVASQFSRVVPNAPFVVVPVRGLLERQF